MIEEEREEAGDAKKIKSKADKSKKESTIAIPSPLLSGVDQPALSATEPANDLNENLTVGKEESEVGDRLSVQEIQAIGDFAMGSSVCIFLQVVACRTSQLDCRFKGRRRKSRYLRQAWRQSSQKLSCKDPQIDSRASHLLNAICLVDRRLSENQGATIADKSPVNKSVSMMKNALNSMLDKLKIKIDVTEKVIYLAPIFSILILF